MNTQFEAGKQQEATMRSFSSTGRWHLQLRNILWPRRWHCAAVVGLILITALLEGVSFSLIVPLVQTLASNPASQDRFPVLFRMYNEWLVRFPVNHRLAVVGLAFIALFSAKNGLQYFREIYSVRLWMQIAAETRMKVLAATLHRPYRYFLERKHGGLVQQLYQEPYHVGLIVQACLDQIANFLAITVLVILLLVVSWKLTAMMLIFGMVYGPLIWRLSRGSHVGGKNRQIVDAEATGLLSEAISGIRQIKVFSSEERIQRSYESLVERWSNVQTGQWRRALLPHRITELFWVGVLGLLLCLPALGYARDLDAVLPMIALFSAVAFRIGPYLSRNSQGWLSIKFLFPALQVVTGLLEEHSSRSLTPVRWKQLDDCPHSIAFENVTFSYTEGHAVLCQFSAVFLKGQSTAIIGRSGAGKSTVVDLLLRLQKPSRGRITIDGHDLAEYDLDAWLKQIGFVSQDTFIFNATIRENIAFGWPQASDDEITWAAKQADAHEFIQGLQNAYDTEVGDRGLKLSGGQRQRLAIARAILRRPGILIFDEATSALDHESEQRVQQAIERISKDRTVILIAHRLSTIKNADKIVVLHGGRIVEEGSHTVLLQRQGVYASLYKADMTRQDETTKDGFQSPQSSEESSCIDQGSVKEFKVEERDCPTTVKAES